MDERDKMKKLLIITSDMKPNVGGVAELVATFAEELTHWYEVCIVTNVSANDDHDAAYPFEVARITLRKRDYNFWDRFFVLKKYRGLLYRMRMRRNRKGIVREALRMNPDQVLVGSCTKQMGCIGGELVDKKIPCSVYIHGRDFGLFRSTKNSLIENAQNIFVNSNFTAGILRAGGVGNRNITVIHPPVRPRVWQEAPRHEGLLSSLGIEQNRYILSLGRMVPRKGFAMVIEVLPALMLDYPWLRYVVCGKETEYTMQLKEKVTELELEERVIFYEAPAGDMADRKTLLKNCLFHVMPSRREAGGDVEGFGISYIEAAIFGKPSIAGREGGCAEAVIDGETGAVIDGCDEKALFAVLKDWLDSPETVTRLGEKARKRALNEFDARKAASKMASFLG